MEMLNGENKNKGNPRERRGRKILERNKRTTLISGRINLIRDVLLGRKRFVLVDHVEVISMDDMLSAMLTGV